MSDGWARWYLGLPCRKLMFSFPGGECWESGELIKTLESQDGTIQTEISNCITKFQKHNNILIIVKNTVPQSDFEYVCCYVDKYGLTWSRMMEEDSQTERQTETEAESVAHRQTG